MKRIAILAILAVGSGCETSTAVTNAVINTAIATGVAAKRAADGECITPCTPGTRCNLETQLCEKIPCAGECTDDQYCDESGIKPRCVYLGDTGLEIVDEPKSPDPHESIPAPETSAD